MRFLIASVIFFSAFDAYAECADANSPQLRGDIVYIATAEGGFLDPLQVKPGETRTLVIYVRRGPSWEHPKACVTWKLDTPELGSLDEETGILKVAKDAKHGAVIRVSGMLRGAKAPLTASLNVFRAGDNPLAGMWHEVAQIACDGKSEPKEFEPIREFEVRADGSYSVTWHPFESYRDYWGQYHYDLAKGTVQFDIESGNYKPADFHGEGRFKKDDKGQLRLEGVWLGARSEREGARACGHVFSQR